MLLCGLIREIQTGLLFTLVFAEAHSGIRTEDDMIVHRKCKECITDNVYKHSVKEDRTLYIISENNI